MCYHLTEKEMHLYLYAQTIITIKPLLYLVGSREPHSWKDVSERNCVQELCNAPCTFSTWKVKVAQNEAGNYVDGEQLLGTVLKFTCLLEEVFFCGSSQTSQQLKWNV